MDGAKLCAACDRNPEVLEKAKKRYEAKGLYDCTYYTDYDKMLKSDIDAVFVATEGVHHVPIVKKAMVAGKHVLILAASVTTGYTALGAIEAVRYYGGHVAGVASVFATIDTVQGLPVRACFNPKDLPDYASHAAHECPQCKAGVKLDALVNGFGYSKL